MAVSSDQLFQVEGRTDLNHDEKMPLISESMLAPDQTREITPETTGSTNTCEQEVSHCLKLEGCYLPVQA